MRTYICENPKCRYHKPTPVNSEDDSYIDLYENGGFVRVKRHKYRSIVNRCDFYLCDTCHKAVQMVREPYISQN